MIIYVIGRVNRPGMFTLNTGVSVLQALAMAGGLNPFAKRSKIKVFRENGGETRIFPFDYDDVTKGEGLGQNIQLRRGDTVVVP
jgi:polysaccharide export outer membrane protein